MGEARKISVLVADDDPPTLDLVRGFLEEDPDVGTITTVGDGVAALAAIVEAAPDLVFLDIKMPGGPDGFDVIEGLPPETKAPVVVFITGDPAQAVRAFEVSAVHYLLKPFDGPRFHAALGRAKKWLAAESGGGLSQRALSLLEDLSARAHYVDRIVVKTAGRIFLLRADEIDWIEADGKYVHLHAGGESHLITKSIGALEAQLDPHRFARIHRSTIVNIDRVRELQQLFNGEYCVLLHDGTELTLSRGCRPRLAELLGDRL